jgi:phage protein D
MTVSTEHQFTEIYRNRDFYVPAFDIKINGKDLPNYASKDVIDVRYTDSIDNIDSFEITVNNWDAKEQDFKYTGSRKGTRTERDQLFDPNQQRGIELWMGYFKPSRGSPSEQSTGLQLMLMGLITRITPSFPASGQPTLKVSGKNFLRNLMTRQETHSYERKRDSDIAEQVGRRGNLRIGNLVIPVRTDPQAKNQEPENEHVIQDNQYDIVFLLQRAHKNGYDLVLRGEGKEQHLFFGPSLQDSRNSYSLEWGKSLIQFQPSITVASQVYSVTVNGWDAAQGKRISVTVDRSDLPPSNRGPRDSRKLNDIEEGFRERQEVIADMPFRNKAEAKQYALSLLSNNAKDLITGQGSTVGTPGLRAGRSIDIGGLGKTFSGIYTVKSTTHTINASGYITEFEVSL